MAGTSEKIKIIIPSPLKKRDFIHHRGDEYQIIKFQSTVRKDRLIYTARNTRTNRVVNLILPFEIQHEEEQDNYFQILDLNEDVKEVTLKSFMTGNERMIKVRADEDVKLIKSGLMEKDKDMFCTLESNTGKEVIGSFKLEHKIPPIMRMPPEMLDLIFSKLTPEDHLSCRLVTPEWATLLPINKIVTCIRLFIDQDPEQTNPITAVLHASWGIPNYKTGMDEMKKQIQMKDLQPLIDSSLLQGTPSLYINAKSRMEQHIQTTVSQHCRKLKQFVFEDEVEETEAVESNWIWAKQIIASNAQQLQTLKVSTSLRELDLSGTQIRECVCLQYLHLGLPQTHSVLSCLESVTKSIVELTTGSIAILSKSQLLWIASNFRCLKYASLGVRHNHSGTNNVDDEVDRNTILEVMNCCPSLRRLSLQLGPFIQGGRGSCGKAIHLRGQGFAPFHCSLLFQVKNDPTGGFETLNVKRQVDAWDLFPIEEEWEEWDWA